MADLSIDCPSCGKANALPVDHAEDTFACSSCGEVSPLDAATTTGAPSTDYLVGEVISDCKILEKVGEGGFGSVYRATDQNLQRVVAFKVMLQSLTTNAEFVQKFIREAVTAAQLNHPNIVSIHKVGRDEKRGLHYLIMEFVEGRTLADIVKEQGVLKIEEAIPIMLQSCEALATAHEHNIVHRDIKPENLMLDLAGQVKITDFGLAKSLSTDQKTTKVMGTPHYMSPEQFEGKQVDGRSDIYSLGVTFYFLLSKGRPYEGQNTVQIIYAILTQQPKPLPEVNKEVPAEIWTVIQRMIAKKAEDRYPTLRETITDLKRFADRTVVDRAQCPSCGAKNPKGRKFCRACGAALVVKCPSCGADNAAGAAACAACGADIAKLVKIKKAMEAAARFKSVGDLRRAAEAYGQVVALDATHGEAKAEFDRLAGTLTEVQRVRTEADDLVRTGDLESALARVEDLLRRYPMATEVREQRDDLKTALAQRRVNHLVEKAEAAIAAGQMREALDLYDQALRTDATRDDVRLRREELSQRLASVGEARQKAAQALAAGRFEQAFALASEVLKVTPGDAAMEDVRRRSQASVESVDQFVQRGRKLIAGGRLGEALAEFESAMALRPGEAQIRTLHDETRARVDELRDRVVSARRLMADRSFDEAATHLKGVLAELPDDAETKSLLAACERGRLELERSRKVAEALEEGDRLEKAGDLAGALAKFQRVLELEPQHGDAGQKKEQVEQKIRGERDIRELANEHLMDGRYADAVSALERLVQLNPARAGAVRAEVLEARKREERVKAALTRAEEALSRKEYRHAQDSVKTVLDVAPRHPRGNAIKKDADKAIAAIDRFFGECDRLLLSEMFDEANEALDKARERGATPEEFKPRREACEQGRLALLKNDATRSIVAKDYEAAIAAYDQVLEVSRDDPDAIRGKRSAERRIRILTTEPIVLRASAAAAVLLLLAVVRVTAVAATAEAKVVASLVVSVEAEKRSTVEETNKRQLEPILDAAEAAERGEKWADAKAAYAEQERLFPKRAELLEGMAFADAMTAAIAKATPEERIVALGGAEAHFGERPERREARKAAARVVRDSSVREWLAEAETLEAKDAQAARRLYQRIEVLVPEAKAVTSKANYLEQLEIGEIRLAEGRFERAAESFIEARREVQGDERKRGNVDARLDTLRTRWIASIAAAARDAGADEQRYYASVVSELAKVARTLASVGVNRDRVLDEFRKAR